MNITIDDIMIFEEAEKILIELENKYILNRLKYMEHAITEKILKLELDENGCVNLNHNNINNFDNIDNFDDYNNYNNLNIKHSKSSYAISKSPKPSNKFIKNIKRSVTPSPTLKNFRKIK
jgi:hypothetical protein